MRTVPASSQATWRTSRDLPGLGVDLDDGDVRAERERRARARRTVVSTSSARRRRVGRRAPRGRPTTSRPPACRRRGSAPVVLVEHDVGDVGLEQLGGERLGPGRPARSPPACTAAPPCCSERDPIVPPPTGTRSVSPQHDVDAGRSGCPARRWRSSTTTCRGPGRAARCRCRRSPCRRRGPRSWRPLRPSATDAAGDLDVAADTPMPSCTGSPRRAAAPARRAARRSRRASRRASSAPS